MTNRILSDKRRPFMLFAISVLLFALINLAVAIVMGVIYTPLAKQYGIYLSAWWRVIVPVIAIVVMYPKFGVPLVRTKSCQPLSRQAIKRQAFEGLVFLPPLAVFAEIGIILLAKLASPLSAVPIIGDISIILGSLIPSYIIAIIIFTTYIAAVLGVWCSLAFYWLVQKFRS